MLVCTCPYGLDCSHKILLCVFRFAPAWGSLIRGDSGMWLTIPLGLRVIPLGMRAFLNLHVVHCIRQSVLFTRSVFVCWPASDSLPEVTGSAFMDWTGRSMNFCSMNV